MARSPCLSRGKSTNNDRHRYLDFKSHHLPQHKHSLRRRRNLAPHNRYVCGAGYLINRAKNIPSTEEEVSQKTKQVSEALTANNYPAKFIHNDRQPNRQQGMNDTDQRGKVILPYAKGFSDRIANILRGFSIKVAHKQSQTYLKSQKTRSRKSLPE